MWYTIIIITEGLGDNKTTCSVMIFLKKKGDQKPLSFCEHPLFGMANHT